MDFDSNDPPVQPPAACRHRLVWTLARALWEAHRPNADGFCSVTTCQRANHLYPCPSIGLALDGLRAACGEDPPTAVVWRDLARKRITGQLNEPADPVWHCLNGARCRLYGRW